MNLLQPKVILGISSIAIFALLVSLAQEMNRRMQIQREVQQLESEVQIMRKSVIELENLNQYFKTDAYQERLAREKLNYRAEGEKMVLIPNETTQAAEKSEQNTTEQESRPIIERWWRLFFVDKVS